MGTADLHPVQVRMLVQKLPHLLRCLYPDVREGLVSEDEGVTRTGYRFKKTTGEKIVREAQGEFVQQCWHEGCWLIVQGGDQAIRAHINTVHGD